MQGTRSKTVVVRGCCGGRDRFNSRRYKRSEWRSHWIGHGGPRHERGSESQVGHKSTGGNSQLGLFSVSVCASQCAMSQHRMFCTQKTFCFCFVSTHRCPVSPSSYFSKQPLFTRFDLISASDGVERGQNETRAKTRMKHFKSPSPASSFSIRYVLPSHEDK